jgi:uncharacterized protein with HEPN domain
MSPERRWQLRVEHMLAAISNIQRSVAGLTAEQFASEGMIVDAVIRNFQVLGEAARHVPDDIQARYPEVPWSVIQGMRHYSFTITSPSRLTSSGEPSSRICRRFSNSCAGSRTRTL